MKKIILTLLLHICAITFSFSQQTDKYYETAYNEIAGMLDNKTGLSIKRAVFLGEWAYLGGKLDFNKYAMQIDSSAKAIKQFYVANRLNQFKTGLNVALFEYFTRPHSMNGNTPFTYDYDDFAGSEDFTKLFVTKVMRTHSGQCHCLPLYYKVLAEAIGAEAYIAHAPQHSFIRHRDEQNPTKWVNVELTSQSLSREIFYIESFGISDDAIRNKLYLYPLTDKETVAFLLSCLTQGYYRKYRKWDDFTLRCAEKVLEHYPQDANSLIVKLNIQYKKLTDHLKNNNQKIDSYAVQLNKEWHALDMQLKGLGWTSEMPDHLYENLLKNVKEDMEQQGMDQQTIQKETNKQRLLNKKQNRLINNLNKKQ